MFLLLYRRGLAYRATAPVNWCPQDKTVLANEEVVNGRCWRCSSLVEKRPMPQWFFRIPEYADRLISGLDTIAWGDRKHQRRFAVALSPWKVDRSPVMRPSPPA